MTRDSFNYKGQQWSVLANVTHLNRAPQRGINIKDTDHDQNIVTTTTSVTVK